MKNSLPYIFKIG